MQLFERAAARKDSEKDLIELRSDTLTKPDAKMRFVMATAEVGDAVVGTDPTVLALERKVAELTGKEAALFVPTGTMGNLVSVMCHCDGRSVEVIVGDKAHQLLYEAGNLATVGGIQTRSVPTNRDGTLSVDAIKAAIRGIDQHFPTTRAVLLENTHNACGGKVLPVAYVKEVRAMLDAHPARPALHCDGARIWHAAVAQGLSLKEVLEPFDTASLCMSKGLGAPAGAMIVGTKALVEGKARRYAKMLGGIMRQTGVVASACLYALDNQYVRLAEDHAAARSMYEALTARGIAAEEPQSNIIIWAPPKAGTAARVVELCANEQVMLVVILGDTLRAIPHYGCGLDVARAVDVIARAHAAILAE